ncbi:MAG: helix-turn-helix transcriptional regulator [Polyangiaceae bacterium]
MAESSFGSLLRRWRTQRRFTQLALANEAEVSARHLSYLETGRSQPSREMVLALASSLEVPLDERNRLLLSAGYAPAYRADGLSARDALPIHRALRFLLERHQPYPATVVDPSWNLVMANDAYLRLTQWVAGAEMGEPAPRRIIDGPPLVGTNALIQLFDPMGLRPFVENFDEVAATLIGHLRRAARDDVGVLATLHRIERLGPIPSSPPTSGDGRLPLVIPLRLAVRGEVLSLFSTMTMIGTATDTLLAALRLETYFPADEDTDHRLRRVAGASVQPGMT